jgi:type II secretory pathway pseudopilin PulG
MPHRRAAFTIVEALVAIAMMGIAGAFLAAAYTVTTAARRSAVLDARSADAVHLRIAFLSRRPCAAPDTSATVLNGRVMEAWRARRSGSGWNFVDSVAMPGAPPRASVTGTVPCR